MPSRNSFIAILAAAAFLTSVQADLPILGGINLSGLEWGMDTSGNADNPADASAPPISQISHFTGEGANLFRVPLAWQYMQPTLGGSLNSTYEAIYDNYITTATSAGAYSIVDIHNYARWDGNIIGESSSVPASDLADLWTKLATKYSANSKVIFGLMNEPHDLTLSTWATTAQTVVTAIRKAGATNTILIPGDNWTGLWAFSTWYQSMKSVTNPDGSFTNLVFDVHRYLDSDGSGTSTTCTANRTDELATAVSILKADNRQALLSETGGGSTSSCETLLPELLSSVKAAYPHVVGYSIWSAGSFASTYELSCVPINGVDTAIWDTVIPYLPGV